MASKKQIHSAEEESFIDAEEVGAVIPAPRSKRVRVDRTEEFEEPLPEPPAAPAPVAAKEPEPPPVQLSDAELLMQQVSNDSEYWMRVDRLLEFSADGRTDTQAAKEFCCNISPVTLDVLDKIQRRYGPGDYLLSMFKRGQPGVVRRWDEHIAKPISAEVFNDAPQPVPPPVQPVIVQQGDELGSFFARMKDFGETMRVLGFNKREQQPPPAPTLPPAPPPDPAQQITQTLDLYKQITSITGGPNTGNGGGGGGWMEGAARIIEALGDGLGLKAIVPSLVQAAAMAGLQKQAGGQPQANGQPAQLPSAMPALNDILPPQLIGVLDVIGEDVLNYEPDDENEISDDVLRSRDAILDLAKAAPEFGGSLQELLSKPPIELIAVLSGRAGLPIPGAENLRFRGYEYIAKKKYADSFFRELQQAVMEAQAEMQSNATADMQQSVAEVSEETGAE
jgi:hypothetical protein